MSFLPKSALLLNPKWMRLASPYWNKIFMMTVDTMSTDFRTGQWWIDHNGRRSMNGLSRSNRWKKIRTSRSWFLQLTMTSSPFFEQSHFSGHMRSPTTSPYPVRNVCDVRNVGDGFILMAKFSWPKFGSPIGYPSLANSIFFRTGPKSTNRIIFLFFEFCDLSL